MSTGDKSAGSPKSFHWTDVLLIVLLCFITFANSIPVPFIWDDKPLIVQNEPIRDFKKAATQFLDPGGISDKDDRSSGHYRPLVLVSFMVDRLLWNSRAAGYHLTNIVAHAVAAVLVYLFIGIFYQRPAALLGALLFASHPIHINAVTYISGRSDVIAALFSLASVVAYSFFALRTGGTRFLLLALSGVFFCFALLSKESSSVVILLIAMVDLLLIADGQFKRWVRCMPHYLLHLFVLIFWLLIRSGSVSISLRPREAFCVAFPNRLEAVSRATVSLLTMFVVPLSQHFERFYRVPMGLREPAYVWSALFICFLLAMSFATIKYRPKAAFMMLWFWISYFPVSNIVPLYPSLSKTVILTGEQSMYLPSAGLCGLVGLMAAAVLTPRFKATPRTGRSGRIAAVLLLATISLLTVRHNSVWRDPIRFYEKSIGYNPLNYRAHQNLGTELMERGLYGRAEREFLRVLEIYPSSANALHNLAILYTKQGRTWQAIEIYSDLLDRYPHDAEAHFHFGVILLKQQNLGASLTHLAIAVRLDEHFAEAHSALGGLFRILGHQRKARIHLEKAISIKPELLAARINLGNVYESLGLYRLAAEQYSSVLRLRPDLEFIKDSLGRSLRAQE